MNKSMPIIALILALAAGCLKDNRVYDYSPSAEPQAAPVHSGHSSKGRNPSAPVPTTGAPENINPADGNRAGVTAK